MEKALIFEGPQEVNAYVMIVMANALDFYVKTGYRINRAYTPKNMLATAERLTGLKFNKKEYARAAAELRNLAGVH